jgi:hypothetical protein
VNATSRETVTILTYKERIEAKTPGKNSADFQKLALFLQMSY